MNLRAAQPNAFRAFVDLNVKTLTAHGFVYATAEIHVELYCCDTKNSHDLTFCLFSSSSSAPFLSILQANVRRSPEQAGRSHGQWRCGTPTHRHGPTTSVSSRLTNTDRQQDGWIAWTRQEL